MMHRITEVGAETLSQRKTHKLLCTVSLKKFGFKPDTTPFMYLARWYTY
jgi:hypothetical protein